MKNCIKRHLKRLSQVQWCPDNAALSFMIPAQFVDRLQARVLLRAFCFLYTPICVPICLPLISPPLPFWPFLHCSAIRHMKVHPEEAGETSVLTNLKSENLRQRWFHKVLTPLENGKMRIWCYMRQSDCLCELRNNELYICLVNWTLNLAFNGWVICGIIYFFNYLCFKVKTRELHTIPGYEHANTSVTVFRLF